MAFDRTNQADLNALKTEVETDPISMGYNPTGGTQPLLNLLNDPSNNVGGETTAETLTVDGLLDAIASSPDDASVDAQFSDGLQLFIGKLLNRDLETDIEQYRAAIQSSMQVNNPIRVFMEAQTRALSRAEVLFGVDTVISREDWFAARDNGVIT